MKKVLKVVGIVVVILIVLTILLWSKISQMIVTRTCVKQLGKDYKAVKTADLPKYGIEISHSDQKWTCVNKNDIKE